MAVCGSLRPLFEKPLPENPTLMESLSSWNSQIKPMQQPLEQSSFTEIFGELHFKEKTDSIVRSPSAPALDQRRPPRTASIFDTREARNDLDKRSSLDSLLGKPLDNAFPCNHNSNGGGFSSLESMLGSSPMNSESLQLCTEGLGFESSDDVEDSRSESGRGDLSGQEEEEKGVGEEGRCGACPRINWAAGGRSARRSVADFPPPISSIGSSGKPCISFKSYKRDGRFVLKEVRIPKQEFLHASRKDGRLKLHLVFPRKTTLEEEEEEEAETDEEEAGEEVAKEE